ncbi:lyase family protein [Jannaschia sp. M317]|uniref:lyase family protein n=1 Tax=Jannaschia sp. M317 TaxID=2867011 RepID=UPI0021A2EBD6|nr:lyase family protein [Jannaschia sp. M317]UWQ18622.1 adenylosuccinate lyase family protein [Jannaschia sp. M317]
MTVAPQDSQMFRDLFADAELSRLFTDTATLRAMLIVEGALAKVQGEAGVIPQEAATYLHRATMELQIDPGGLAAQIARDGIPVPALLAAFRKEAQAPEFTRYLHWAANSQDIVDTALALRLRQVLTLLDGRLDALLTQLADLAEAHAETPMLARTFGQPAVVTTFGAAVATWGSGLLALRSELPDIRAAVCIVTLNGAAGTLSAMGPEGPALRSALARALGLADPGHSPQVDRSHLHALASWANRVLQACDKIAGDLLLLSREGAVTMGGGQSSTMAQKRNPIASSVVRALALHGNGLCHTLHAATPADQRDGGAWFAEWLALPQLMSATGKALLLLTGDRVTVEVDAMAATLAATNDLIHAEALTFALARDMPRPEAQAQVAAWAAETRVEGGSLLARAGVDPADYAPARQWGEAPALARRFAQSVRE